LQGYRDGVTVLAKVISLKRRHYVMAILTRPRVTDMDQETEDFAETTAIRKVNYEEFARQSGDEAYQNAKDAGLPEPIAKRFREVFGHPIEPEFRPS
jgi:sugar/nucleoside kinase (ribokinase family)